MPDCSIKRFLVVLGAAAFGLNLVWELTQLFAFSSLDKASAFEVVVLVLIASLADALITLAAYLVTALRRRKWRWQQAVGASDFLIFAIVGVIAATLIETIALSRGTWAYGDYMLIVPMLEVGLLPLLQLTILLPVALWFALRWCGLLPLALPK